MVPPHYIEAIRTADSHDRAALIQHMIQQPRFSTIVDSKSQSQSQVLRLKFSLILKVQTRKHKVSISVSVFNFWSQ